MTVNDLIEELKKYPRRAIVVMASDAEINEVSTMDRIYQGKIGKKVKYKVNEKDIEFIDGDDFKGINMDVDKGKMYCMLAPLY